jgi:hypothetical protein
MNRRQNIKGALIMCLLLLNSCMDEFNRSNETVYYNPSFSVPIGPLSYTLQEIMPYATLGAPIPDSIITSDSVTGPILIYDDSLFFKNPEEGRDTFFYAPVDFRSLATQWEYIRSLMFRVNVSNGLPVTVSTQLYFLNDGDVLIDSLYTGGRIWIQSAQVDETGIVSGPYTNMYDMYIDSVRIHEIIGATRMKVYVFLETYNSTIDTLRVYSSYHFDLQLAVRAELLSPLQ